MGNNKKYVIRNLLFNKIKWDSTSKSGTKSVLLKVFWDNWTHSSKTGRTVTVVYLRITYYLLSIVMLFTPRYI